MVLGGSITFGDGASSVESNYCSQLEDILNQHAVGQRYEVVNCGVPAYSSWHGRQFVQHYMEDLKPDIIILAFGWNDSNLDVVPDSNTDYKGPHAHVFMPNFIASTTKIGYILRRGYIMIKYLLLGLGTRPLNKKGVEGVPRVSLDEFRANYRAIWEWTQNNSVKILFLTEPAAWQSRKGQPSIVRYQIYAAEVRKLGADLSIPVADIAAKFTELDPKVFFTNSEIDYVHPN